MSKWRKRLAMTPEDVVSKTFEATTQFYISIAGEDRMDPRRYLKSRDPGLRANHQHEGVSSDTFFPSKTSNRGTTCSQIFVGKEYDRWEVYPMKTESHNGTALQDYTRACGVPYTIKTDNAQSEIGKLLTDHCRTHCIATETTEACSPW